MQSLLNYTYGTIEIEFDTELELEEDDPPVCDCCGHPKSQIIRYTIPMVVTDDGGAFFVGDRGIDETDAQPLFLTTLSIDSDGVYADLPFFPANVGIVTFAENLLRFLDAVFAEIEADHDGGFELDTPDVSDLDFGVPTAPKTIVHGQFGVPHPLLPDDAVFCAEHGVEFVDELEIDKETFKKLITEFAVENGYVDGRGDGPEHVEFSRVEKWLNQLNDEEVGREFEAYVIEQNERDVCCEAATATWTMNPEEVTETDHHRLKTLLRRELEGLIDELENPYNEVGYPSTDSLLPWLYVHGVDAVELWNVIRKDVFSTPEHTHHPVLNPSDEAAEYVTDPETSITRVQYVRMMKDLFDTLEYEYPTVYTDEQLSRMETAMEEEFGVVDAFGDESTGGVWEPLLGDDLQELSREISESDDVNAATTRHYGQYDSITDHSNDAFTYEPEDVLEQYPEGTLLSIPIEDVARYSGYDMFPDVDLICRVEDVNFVPRLPVEEILVEEGSNENGMLLPEAVWLNPVLIQLREDETVTVSELNSLARRGYNNDKKPVQGWFPMTTTALEAATEIEKVPKRIGPQPAETVSGLIGFEEDGTANVQQKKTLADFVDNIDDIDGIDELKTFVYPYHNFVTGDRGWTTGVVVSEFPVTHSSDDGSISVPEETSPFVRTSINVKPTEDGDERVVQNPRPLWGEILPDDFDLTDTDEPLEAIRRVIKEETPYNLEDAMEMYQLELPVAVPENVEPSSE